MKAPDDLGSGGKRLWREITDKHELEPGQHVQLHEACRAKDRCDYLAKLLDEDFEEKWLKQATATANLMKQLIAALRLPDEKGNRPAYHGPRGAQQPSIPGGARVSSLDRARSRATG